MRHVYIQLSWKSKKLHSFATLATGQKSIFSLLFLLFSKIYLWVYTSQVQGSFRTVFSPGFVGSYRSERWEDAKFWKHWGMKRYSEQARHNDGWRCPSPTLACLSAEACHWDTKLDFINMLLLNTNMNFFGKSFLSRAKAHLLFLVLAKLAPWRFHRREGGTWMSPGRLWDLSQRWML